MSVRPEAMRYDRMYRFLWLYAAALALFGLALDSPAGIAAGLRTIVLTEDALITDYVLIAGPGAALVNAALVTAISTLCLRLAREPLPGSPSTASPWWWWGSCPASPCSARTL